MKTLVITLAALLILYLSYRTYRILTLTKGLEKIIAKGALVLDVRTETEYKTGHIKGSVNIPLSRLHEEPIPFDTSTVLITCCSHGLRSVKAMKVLKSRGFPHVYNGGAWNDLEKKIRNSTAK